MQVEKAHSRSVKMVSVRVRRARRVLTGSVQHADASLGICAKLCIHLGGFAGDMRTKQGAEF